MKFPLKNTWTRNSPSVATLGSCFASAAKRFSVVHGWVIGCSGVGHRAKVDGERPKSYIRKRMCMNRWYRRQRAKSQLDRFSTVNEVRPARQIPTYTGRRGGQPMEALFSRRRRSEEFVVVAKPGIHLPSQSGQIGVANIERNHTHAN